MEFAALSLLKHQSKVEAIESIRQARLETFWTDDLDKLPTEPQQTIWWEVWCFKGMAEKTLDVADRLGARVASEDYRLYFPETTSEAPPGIRQNHASGRL